ncbi:hypothetical protein AX16_007799 [Volvariella volvacea WC 439]|nr:hypothetical protein AX16_007799 [Volvariella volvacea WC 439]
MFSRSLVSAARRAPRCAATLIRSSPAISRHLPPRSLQQHTLRGLHTSLACRDKSFTNILADDTPPPVQVKSISEEGIQLSDGLLIPSACVFLEGQVFLWDVPQTSWQSWSKEYFELFEVVVPRPEILILGTGKTLSQPPPFIRQHLASLGIQLEVMDTRNACSTYNLLSEEGRRVAAALLPYTSRTWQKTRVPQ